MLINKCRREQKQVSIVLMKSRNQRKFRLVKKNNSKTDSILNKSPKKEDIGWITNKDSKYVKSNTNYAFNQYRQNNMSFISSINHTPELEIPVNKKKSLEVKQSIIKNQNQNIFTTLLHYGTEPMKISCTERWSEMNKKQYHKKSIDFLKKINHKQSRFKFIKNKYYSHKQSKSKKSSIVEDRKLINCLSIKKLIEKFPQYWQQLMLQNSYKFNPEQINSMNFKNDKQLEKNKKFQFYLHDSSIKKTEKVKIKQNPFVSLLTQKYNRKVISNRDLVRRSNEIKPWKIDDQFNDIYSHD